MKTAEEWARLLDEIEVLYSTWSGRLDVIRDIQADAQPQWISTKERLPEKPGKEDYEYVECLILYNGNVLCRPWNCEHLVWDDEDHDDFFCKPLEPTLWMPIPEPPEGKS